MKKPTTTQVIKEADKLEEMKPNIRRFSGFGDDHHEAIDAQVRTLRDYTHNEIFDESDIDAEYEDSPDNVQNAARDAFLWADGSSDYEGEYGTPSEQWQSLVKPVSSP